MPPRLRGPKAIQGGVDEDEPASSSAGPVPPPSDGCVCGGGRGDYEIKDTVYFSLTTALTPSKQIVFGNDGVKIHVSAVGNIGDGETGKISGFADSDNLHYLVNDNSYTRKDDKQTEATYMADGGYTATLDSNTESAEVTCVVWYEGANGVVVTDKTIEKAITASLAFCSRGIEATV